MRYLIYHAESEALFEVYTSGGRQQCLQDGCDDVTNLPKFETLFNQPKGSIMSDRERSTRRETTERSSRASEHTERHSGRSSQERDGGRSHERGSSRSDREPAHNFQYRKPTADDVKKRAEQKGGGEFDSILKDGVNLFKVNDDDNLIRILPPTWKDAKHFGYDIYVHFGVGPDNQAYLCPKEMLGQDCPICEERARAVKSGDEEYAKELKVTKRVLVYLVDRDNEKEGVQAWSMPWTVDRDINTLIVDKRSGEVIAVDDPDEGYDIQFTKTGSKLTTKYIGMQIARKKSDIGDNKWLNYAIDHPLPEQLLYFDYDHIAKVFGGQASKKDLDEEQEDGLRKSEERGSRDREVTDLTFESVHGMTYDELCDIVDAEKLGDKIIPQDSKSEAELADWICEDLNLKENTRSRPARDTRPEPSREEKLQTMRRRD